MLNPKRHAMGNPMVMAAALGMAILLPVQAAQAAQLSGDAKSAIPQNLQQMISVDYDAMQNSPTAMQLKERVLPPELKRLEVALKSSGMDVSQDVDVLAFAAFRTGSSADQTRTVGIAQGQFQTRAIMANFTKKKIKPMIVRNNSIYPMGNSGMSVVFLNQTTMLFGDLSAVKSALDARDGITPNLLSNNSMMDSMASVDKEPVWSILDQKGTQVMMRSLMGDASGLTDYEAVQKRLLSSRYTMNFNNGVAFDMQVVTGDTMAAATAATLMKGAILFKTATADPIEKAALNATTVDSNSGVLEVKYSSSDSQFANLLHSDLFQSVVK
ncbi:MAG: hypothetical protein ACYC46_13785 [Acidobacteriaceae bacterium]